MMTTNPSLEFSRRLYGGLLHLFPRDFLEEFGAPMLQLFTDQCRSAMREKGTPGLVFLWLRTISDLIASVLREHLVPDRASLGLLEAVPDRPLPWKGVVLVMIPGLVFFIGQIGQLAGEDWFFLLVRRAAYYLILPVLLVWFLKRKFPIWGLIPLGMFSRAILDLSNRYEYLLGKAGVFLADMMKTDMPPGFILFQKAHIPEIRILMITIILGTVVFLIARIARRGGFARSSWTLLGAFFIVTILEILSGLIRIWINTKNILSADPLYFGVPTILKDVANSAFYASQSTLGFLLLILAGVLLARRHGRLALLLPLGYLIPAVLLGRFDYDARFPNLLLAAGAAVMIYRVFVTVIAPVWIVRSASERDQFRAGSIGLLTAVGFIAAVQTIYTLAVGDVLGWEVDWTRLYYSLSPQLLTLAGIGLAITLYRKGPEAPVEAIPTPIPA
jgi:hypothetical protein